MFFYWYNSITQRCCSHDHLFLLVTVDNTRSFCQIESWQHVLYRKTLAWSSTSPAIWERLSAGIVQYCVEFICLWESIQTIVINLQQPEKHNQHNTLNIVHHQCSAILNSCQCHIPRWVVSPSDQIVSNVLVFRNIQCPKKNNWFPCWCCQTSTDVFTPFWRRLKNVVSSPNIFLKPIKICSPLPSCSKQILDFPLNGPTPFTK